MVENNRTDDMSMEDILASIRKYVSDEETKQPPEPRPEKPMAPSDATIISLNEDQIVDNNASTDAVIQSTQPENSAVYSEVSSLSMQTVTTPNIQEKKTRPESPFKKLANALNTYGTHSSEPFKNSSKTDLTIDKFIEALARPLIEKWINTNMPKIVEKIVDREIQRLKEEG